MTPRDALTVDPAPIDWDSPAWGGHIHESSTASWLEGAA